MNRIRIASRASRLALAQAHWVIERLHVAAPDVTFDIVEITTSGDVDRTSPVATLTEIGAFVRAVQTAVIDGVADIAVHSCKDLPVIGPDGLVQHFPLRESPWDVLCGKALEGLGSGSRVGTGSPRRVAQLAALRPDLRIDGIRGNVDTRLGKVASGEYDAVVLAEAGLNRIGRESEITHRFDIATMVPAPAQGALCIETRRDDPAAELASAVDDPTTRRAVEAERMVLSLTGAGCRSALGAYATDAAGRISLTGFVADEHGARRAVVEAVDPPAAARSLRSELGL